MKKNILTFFKYLSCFLFFLLLFTVICNDLVPYDFIWNYGFSHAIRIGEIPYLDFNTISTPLYSFIMAFFLLIWDNFLMFLITQSLLCTLFVSLLFKYLNKLAWFILLILAFPLFKAFIGTYNFLVLILILFLFILETKKKSDLIIGIVLGLLILTKHSIGGVALITNLLFLKDIKRILKRSFGVFLPCLVFFIYLLLTKSLYKFIDLCFIGLFDFQANNGNIFNILGIISIILIILLIIKYFKTKDIKISYVIASYFLAFPLFDFYHFSMFLAIFILYFIKDTNLNEVYIKKLSIIILLIVLTFNILIRIDTYKQLHFLKLNRFEYYLVKDYEKEKFHKLLKKYQEKENTIIVGNHAMIIDIISNRKITYFDITLKGNYGYKGTEKMITKIDNLKDVYFFIDMRSLLECLDKTQLDYKLLTTIIKTSKLVDKVDSYNIYYKE